MTVHKKRPEIGAFPFLTIIRRLSDLLNHIVYGRADFVIREFGVSTHGRHTATSLKGRTIQGTHAVINAVRPVFPVTQAWCARNTRFMTGKTGRFVDIGT
jgi:hypothetical protein